ncbi:MAG TPA: tRNA uridine-5-carboxymethylaminomethyl(34) synthesis GTPase MnmE [Candidatus Binataceae bacterium]
MYVQDTIVAPATPPGPGAVAIVRLSGPRAFEILYTIWRPAPAARGRKLAARRLGLGDIIDPASGALVDRALAVVMPAPASLTGEDVAELQCHGGIYLVRRVVALATAAGARMAEPGEFTRRAFLNRRIDLTEAEAVADLVAARGESALKQALAQLTGALAARVERMRAEVIAIRAHLEVEIDFSDEDLNLPSRHQIAGDLERLIGHVALLHDSFARGRLMRDGARAVIAGKPNVGKSSILNLLLGTERAIVTPIPGTTRDVIEDSIQLGPYPLVLQDTAGLRAVGADGGDSAVYGEIDIVEQIGIERTMKSLAAADLMITVFDASRPFAGEDAEVIRLSAGRAGVAILNKSDLPAVTGAAKLRDSGLGMPILPFSALTAEGVGELRAELTRAIETIMTMSTATIAATGSAAAGGTAASEGIAISRERHREALARALEALKAARHGALAMMPPEIVAVDVAAAADALGQITGEVGAEDILDAVFREFCIGK